MLLCSGSLWMHHFRCINVHTCAVNTPLEPLRAHLRRFTCVVHFPQREATCVELPWACTHFPSHSDHPLCGRSKTCCCWWPPCERAARVPASRTGSCLVAVGAQMCREMMMYNRRRALAATPTVTCGVHDSRAAHGWCARCSHLYTIEQQAHTPNTRGEGWDTIASLGDFSQLFRESWGGADRQTCTQAPKGRAWERLGGAV